MHGSYQILIYTYNIIVRRRLPPPLSLTHTDYSHELYMCSKPDRNGYPTFDLSHDSKAEPTVPFAFNVTDLRFATGVSRGSIGNH